MGLPLWQEGANRNSDSRNAAGSASGNVAQTIMPSQIPVAASGGSLVDHDLQQRLASGWYARQHVLDRIWQDVVVTRRQEIFLEDPEVTLMAALTQVYRELARGFELTNNEMVRDPQERHFFEALERQSQADGSEFFTSGLYEAIRFRWSSSLLVDEAMRVYDVGSIAYRCLDFDPAADIEPDLIEETQDLFRRLFCIAAIDRNNVEYSYSRRYLAACIADMRQSEEDTNSLLVAICQYIRAGRGFHGDQVDGYSEIPASWRNAITGDLRRILHIGQRLRREDELRREVANTRAMLFSSRADASAQRD